MPPRPRERVYISGTPEYDAWLDAGLAGAQVETGYGDRRPFTNHPFYQEWKRNHRHQKRKSGEEREKEIRKKRREEELTEEQLDNLERRFGLFNDEELSDWRSNVPNDKLGEEQEFPSDDELMFYDASFLGEEPAFFDWREPADGEGESSSSSSSSSSGTGLFASSLAHKHRNLIIYTPMRGIYRFNRFK
jgi:hypothetical protein